MRRARGRRRRRILFAAALVAAASMGGWIAETWRATEIRIVGLQSLSPNVVAEAARLEGGERLLLTRLATVQRRVRAVPAIRDATVRRAAWSRVVIRAQERIPLVAVEDNLQLGVDADGVVFERPDARPLPVLRGLARVPRPGTRLRGATPSFLAEFGSFPRELVEQVTVVHAGDRATVALGDGVEIRFGKPEQLQAKAVAAIAVLAEARGRGARLEYVDVRTPSTPVAGEEPTPEPTPVPRAATPRPSAPARSPQTTQRPQTPRPNQAPSPEPSPEASSPDPSDG